MEIMETVLSEMLEEMKQTREQLARLNEQSFALTAKVNAFEKRLREQKIIAAPVDTNPIEQRVKEGAEETRSFLAESLSRLGATLEAYPKNTVRQYRFLFFPEIDPHGLAGRFVDKMLLFLIALIAMGILAHLGSQYIHSVH